MKRIGTTPDGRAILEDENGNRFVSGYQPTKSPITKTNADKIREMSDSELTEELYRLMSNAAKCPDCFWKSGRERLELYLNMESK